jgi:hypothetical protein
MPRSYQTPRTTPPRRLSHAIALELGHAFFQDDAHNEDALIGPDNPMPLSYTLRAGLVERWEVAASAGAGLYASEVKWNFLRSRWFDAAVAPRTQFLEPFVFEGQPGRSVGLSLPAPMALNVNREVSFIVSPAIAYVAGSRSRPLLLEEVAETSELRNAPQERAAVALLGLDLDVRASSRLSLHPGVTLLRRLDNGDERFQFGVSIGWGRMPFYGDVPP